MPHISNIYYTNRRLAVINYIKNASHTIYHGQYHYNNTLIFNNTQVYTHRTHFEQWMLVV